MAAIALDPSAPAEVRLPNSTAATAVTAVFTPPGACLVVASVSVQYDVETVTAPVVSVADSLGGQYEAGPSAFDGSASGTYLFRRYYATSPGAITVTATRSNAGLSMFYVKLWVLTGADASQVSAASGAAHAQTGTVIAGTVTPAAEGGWVLAGAAMASSQAMTPDGLTQDSSWSDTADGASAATGHVVTASLVPETPGWTVTLPPFWSWVALEVVPALVAATGADAAGGDESSALAVSDAEAASGADGLGSVATTAPTLGACTWCGHQLAYVRPATPGQGQTDWAGLYEWWPGEPVNDYSLVDVPLDFGKFCPYAHGQPGQAVGQFGVHELA